MVNLIAGRAVVPELMQDDFKPERVAEEALGLLADPSRARRMRDDLAEVRRKLGAPGASERAAILVREELEAAQRPQPETRDPDVASQGTRARGKNA